MLFLQETKCSYDTLLKVGQRIWKGNEVMAIDAEGMGGGFCILWQPRLVELSKWRASHFSLMAGFKILGSYIIGTVVNTYGPSAFSQKQAFIHHLMWLRREDGL